MSRSGTRVERAVLGRRYEAVRLDARRPVPVRQFAGHTHIAQLCCIRGRVSRLLQVERAAGALIDGHAVHAPNRTGGRCDPHDPTLGRRAMSGPAHVPVPGISGQLSKLFHNAAALASADAWRARFSDYRRRHSGWFDGIPLAFMSSWAGAPFHVKGEMVWPGPAISRAGQLGTWLCLGQQVRWVPELTGSGNATHPIWVGKSVLYAALLDASLENRTPFSLVRADRLKVGARLLAMTSWEMLELNHGVVLGKSGEAKVRFAKGAGVSGFHMYAPRHASIDKDVAAKLGSALAGWRGHVRFQQGVLVTWDWLEDATDDWERDAGAALVALNEVRAAVTMTSMQSTFLFDVRGGTSAVGAAPSASPDAVPDQAPDPVTLKAALAKSPVTELTLRYTGQTRRDATTGLIEVTRPPKLRLPRGFSGTLARWMVSPGDVMTKGQRIAVLRLNDGKEVDLICPRVGHRVVRRCGVGTKVHDRYVIVSLERIS